MLDARYEQLRHAALHARAEAFPLGLGVLADKGVTAWRHALASLAPAVPAPSLAGSLPADSAPPLPAGLAPAATGRAAPATRPAQIPAPVAAELISALAAVALAGAITGPAPLPAVPTEGDPDAP